MRPTQSFDEATLPNGLAAHQLDGLAWLRDRKVSLVADVTGAGKTAVSAAVIAYAMDVEGAERVIWVTEAHLIPQTLCELERFLPTLAIHPWPGHPGDHVRVLSVETLTRHIVPVMEWDAHVGIVDEASSMKGTGAEPAAVSRVLSGTHRRLALTATPVELDATEAYRILRVLGAEDLPPQHVFDSFVEWRDLPYGDQRPYATRPDAVETVRAVFAKYVLRRGVDEVGLRLPDLRDETVLVSLTPPQERAYAAAAGERSPLAQASKREKACAYVGNRSAKAEEAVKWLVAHPDVTKVVIFAEHLRHLDIVERLLDQAGIGWVRLDGSRSRPQRAAATKIFANDPAVRVLLGTKVLERGIDGLQHCGVMLTLGSSFNPAREAQRIGRLRRPRSPHASVRHITFTSSTAHETGKQLTLQRRRNEAVALIHRLPSTQQTEENVMSLSETQIQSLVRTRRWLGPQQVAYGTPLAEAVTAADEMEWLQALVRAGHLPEWEGVELAVAAHIVQVERDVDDEARKVDGMAEFLAGFMGDEFRKAAAALEAAAERLDEFREQLRATG